MPQVSERTGFKVQTIQRHETGENQVSVPQLEIYAKVLDCYPEELLRSGARVSPRIRALMKLAEQLSEEDQDRLLRLGTALTEPNEVKKAS